MDFGELVTRPGILPVLCKWTVSIHFTVGWTLG